MLDRRRLDGMADRLEHGFARCPVVAEYPHLDELVRLERDVDLVQDRGGEAVMPDGDHGIEMVCAGAQGAARGGIEGRHAARV